MEISERTQGAYVTETIIRHDPLSTVHLDEQDLHRLFHEEAYVSQEHYDEQEQKWSERERELEAQVHQLTQLADEAHETIAALAEHKPGTVRAARAAAKSWLERAAKSELVQTEFCSMCRSGHAGPDGRCSRHGKRIRRDPPRLGRAA